MVISWSLTLPHKKKCKRKLIHKLPHQHLPRKAIFWLVTSKKKNSIFTFISWLRSVQIRVEKFSHSLYPLPHWYVVGDMLQLKTTELSDTSPICWVIFIITKITFTKWKMAFDLVRTQDSATLEYGYEDSRCECLRSNGPSSAKTISSGIGCRDNITT